MVLAFTEKQKKEIEVRGTTVIEFKRRLYKTKKTVDDAWQVLKEFVDKITKAFIAFKEKLTKAFIAFKEKFLEAVDGIRLAFEKISEARHYPTSRRYRIAKVFSKCTGTDIRFGWKITWKIKRWLARRYC